METRCRTGNSGTTTTSPDKSKRKERETGRATRGADRGAAQWQRLEQEKEVAESASHACEGCNRSACSARICRWCCHCSLILPLSAAAAAADGRAEGDSNSSLCRSLSPFCSPRLRAAAVACRSGCRCDCLRLWPHRSLSLSLSSLLLLAALSLFPRHVWCCRRRRDGARKSAHAHAESDERQYQQYHRNRQRPRPPAQHAHGQQ